MTTAVFPGSFDPVTLGHVDIVRRALAFADQVIVGVAQNANKTPLLPVDQRVALFEQATAGLPGVQVRAVPGLLVDFCRDVQADLIVKGLRSGADFDAESPMALMNRSLSGIETAFVIGDSALQHVASSFVRDVARHGGDVSAYVPVGVAEAIAARLA